MELIFLATKIKDSILKFAEYLIYMYSAFANYLNSWSSSHYHKVRQEIISLFASFEQQTQSIETFNSLSYPAA
jgi:hypothetical protein